MGLNFPDFFKRSSAGLLGIDISASSVKVVELLPGQKTAIRLERYAIEPIERGAVNDGNVENPELVAAALGRAMRRLGTRTREVALAMPASAVITKRIMLPAGLPEEDYELQVETEASQYIPFAIEEVNLDFQILGPSAIDADEMLADLCRFDLTESNLKQFEEALSKAHMQNDEPARPCRTVAWSCF